MKPLSNAAISNNQITIELLGARSFHFLCLPSEVKRNCAVLGNLRCARGFGHHRPLIVWEPACAACEPDNLKNVLDVLPLVDVFSPSHEELIDLTIGKSKLLSNFSHELIQKQAGIFTKAGIGPHRNGLIVVRCGPYGCFYMKSEKEMGWVRPFYDRGRPEVKDVTGAGSAFLGAFTVSFEATGDVKESCLRGTLAAAFALEQFGLPVYSNKAAKPNRYLPPFRGETWNNENPFFSLGLKEIQPDMFFTKSFP